MSNSLMQTNNIPGRINWAPNNNHKPFGDVQYMLPLLAGLAVLAVVGTRARWWSKQWTAMLNIVQKGTAHENSAKTDPKTDPKTETDTLRLTIYDNSHELIAIEKQRKYSSTNSVCTQSNRSVSMNSIVSFHISEVEYCSSSSSSSTSTKVESSGTESPQSPESVESLESFDGFSIAGSLFDSGGETETPLTSPNPLKPIASLLYPPSVIEVGPTLDEYAVKLVEDIRLRQASQLPFGLRRTKAMSKLSGDVVEQWGLNEYKLSYSAMLEKLSVSFDSLQELPAPTNNDFLANTRYALSFVQAYAPQLNAISQALLDAVNGVRDIERATAAIQRYGSALEVRTRPSDARSAAVKESLSLFTRRYEALLRFHQLFNEYRYAGRARRQAVILACFKERLLRPYNFLKPLYYTDGMELQELLRGSEDVKTAARQHHAESQALVRQWSALSPKLRKAGVFRRGLSEEQADQVMECARGLSRLCQNVHAFQEEALLPLYKAAELKLMQLLLYVDKNKLCIRLSETISFDCIMEETRTLLRTVRGDPHVDEMLAWLTADAIEAD